MKIACFYNNVNFDYVRRVFLHPYYILQSNQFILVSFLYFIEEHNFANALFHILYIYITYYIRKHKIPITNAMCYKEYYILTLLSGKKQHVSTKRNVS